MIQLLGEFFEISMSQSEDMTWKTRKYREISEIFARFAILTKFLSIEFLQTWQLSKTSYDTMIQLLGEFCEISMSQSEDMTWKTRKYREIIEFFARFTILTMFLSIELL